MSVQPPQLPLQLPSYTYLFALLQRLQSLCDVAHARLYRLGRPVFDVVQEGKGGKEATRSEWEDSFKTMSRYDKTERI